MSTLQLTIKDFPQRGSVTFKITSAAIGQKFVNAVRVPRLTVTR